MTDSAGNEICSIKLTVGHDGLVWRLDGCGLPHNTGLDCTAFFSQVDLPVSSVVKVPGLPVNTLLLLGLFQLYKNGVIGRLEVCSPRQLLDLELANDTSLLLYRLRNIQSPSSTGGWHKFNADDFCHYLLVARLFKYQPALQVPLTKVLSNHPSWPALSFIDGLDHENVAALLGVIIDPRWYIDPRKPDRSNKLACYLGLMPRFSGSVRTHRYTSGQGQRYVLVRKCWKDLSKTDPPRSFHPRQFLWRIYEEKGGGFRGELAASKRFISFLRQVWLGEIAGESASDTLFSAEEFFSRKDEMAAYKHHLIKAGS